MSTPSRIAARALAWALLFIPLTVQLSASDASAQEKEATQRDGRSDRQQLQELEADLQRTLARVSLAETQVKRVQGMIKKLEELRVSGEVKDDTAVKATQEALKILKKSLDKLTLSGMEIRDQVKGSVQVDQAALIARLRAREEALTDDDRKRDVQKLVEAVVWEQSRIQSQVTRLDTNIHKLREASSKIAMELDYLDLVREVDAMQGKLADQLEKHNSNMENVRRSLEVSP